MKASRKETRKNALYTAIILAIKPWLHKSVYTLHVKHFSQNHLDGTIYDIGHTRIARQMDLIIRQYIAGRPTISLVMNITRDPKQYSQFSK